MTSFVLLAAGKSSRMGLDKALLDFHGRPWIYQQALSIKNSGCIDQLVIVDQPGKTEVYEQVLVDLLTPQFQIQILENHKKEAQPSDSLSLALEHFKPIAGCLISPIDVPLDSSLIRQFWDQRKSDALAMKVSYQHRGGHPVWLSGPAITSFRAKPTRLDEFLAEIETQYVEIENPVSMLNLNTPEEWKEFLARFSPSK